MDNKNINTGRINTEGGNVFIGDTYNQINNTFKEIRKKGHSTQTFIPESFLDTLPLIKYNLYKEAQALWDSGVNSTMIEGNNIVIEKLLQIYFDLIELIEEEECIKGLPYKDFYKNRISSFIQYVYEAQPTDGGTIHLVISGGKVANIINDCIIDIVKISTTENYFCKWFDSWNDYIEEI